MSSSIDAPPLKDTAARSPRKAKGQGGERREEILAHAIRLFAQKGVHSVSTRHIAEAVGVSQPTLYAYFKTKDELLNEACARAFAELTRRMRATADAPGDRLEALGHAYIRFGLEEPDAYRIAFMREGEAADPQAPADAAMEAKFAVGHGCFDVLREAMRERLGPGHPQIEIVSQSLWAAQHGLVSLLIARSGFPWAEREALIGWHVRALIAGVPR